MLTVSDLTYSYPELQVFDQASFFALPEQVTTILGASGIGKTTLFRLICGLLHPESGSIQWSNQSINENHIAYMRQKEVLLPWRTARENISLLNELGDKKKKKISEEEILEASKVLDITHVLDKYPSELSGGMKQRVELARCLVSNKPVLLLDEPFSSLDPLIKESLYKETTSLAKRNRTTIVLITHDIFEALLLSDKLYVIKNASIHPVDIETVSFLCKKNTRQELIEFLFL
ncbi:ABC transporter ATP-binding protein [Chlamydiifrater phoenicopteri]|uniref:ABC transporter ATP-binding protein n=1 Tax=Chlamydiifrater phoenicopteri TaxID=2681469 RepID=UPI001BCB785A|nr:ABC transporter ATP-binding protein [Chlamydiifrater phoenicopteri]